MRVALVNTNRMKPPIAPIGLDYVAEELAAAGHAVEILDLCWVDDWKAAIDLFFRATSIDLIGVTLRNSDDCAYTSRVSFLDGVADMVTTIRRLTTSPIVLGGAGFSVTPDQVLSRCQADAGIWGDGESALLQFAQTMEEKRPWHEVDNLIWRCQGSWRHNRISLPPLANLSLMTRSWIDNRRYFREGGQAGVETKRGCTGACIYCADPPSKGRTIRLRPAQAVVDEMENLLQQGIDHIHTCDSEFNLPAEHASEVCRELISRRLGERIRWYAYCAPVPFSRDLAALMRRAGCAGINFGVDNGDNEMLRRLRRGFTADDILAAAKACREAGMAVMLDLLLGCPGETRRSVVKTIELMKQSDADRVGVALGVRVYPGTELAGMLHQPRLKTGLVGGNDPAEPLFFLEPDIAPVAFDLVDGLVGDDERFLFFDPSKPQRDYNYNANQRLIDAIQKGYRGAYWDILRRYK